MKNETLLERMARGDNSAVNDFLDRYGGLVWSLARRFTTTNSDAEDAVQEIFVEIWSSCNRYQPEIAAEATFVTMIARRRLIDRQRKKKPEVQGSEVLEQSVLAAKGTESFLEIAEEANRASHLLENLPQDQRQSIKLSVYDGLTHSEIADVTGLTLGTVKSHIRRGLIKLREQLGFSSKVKSNGGVT